MCAIGTILDLNGAVWKMDEKKDAPILVVVVDWDLPDVVNLETTGDLAIVEQ